MNERASPAYFSSVVLHGLVIAVILSLAFVSSQSTPETAQVMELVAGPGDNYMGTAATKLGSETGIALNVPAPPVAVTPAVEPAPAELAPAVPAEPVPAPVAKPAKPSTKLPANPMLKSVTKAEIRAESKIKMHDLKVKKERERAAAAAAAAAKRAEKAESYAEFMKSQQGLAVAPKGRAGGVAAGTTMDDGAGGKALRADQRNALDGWNGLLRQRWLEQFVPPPDFDQKMTVEVTFHVSANGSISDVHVRNSTGGPTFDEAVVEALHHVSMPVFPVKTGMDYVVPFSLRDQG